MGRPVNDIPLLGVQIHGWAQNFFGDNELKRVEADHRFSVSASGY